MGRNANKQITKVNNPMLMAGGSDSFDAENPVAFVNPMKEDDVPGESPYSPVRASTRKEAKLAAQLAVDSGALDSEEVLDLTFAFEACDLDDGGTIDVDELKVVLNVLSTSETEVTRGEIQALFHAAKKDFKVEFAACEQAELDASPIFSPRKIQAVLGDSEKIQMFSPRKLKEKLIGEGGKAPNMLQSMDQDAGDQLNLAEFIHLMTSPAVDKYFPNGWSEGAYHMRLLKNAFSTADIDGDDQLEFDELAVSINALHTGNLTDDDIKKMWDLLVDGDAKKPFVCFREFIAGMVRIQNDEYLKSRFHLFTPDKLMSLVLDTPVSAREERDILRDISMMERIGLNVLNRQAKDMTTEEQRELLKRSQSHEMHLLTDTQRDALRALHTRSILTGILIGFISTVLTSAFENGLTYTMDTDGFSYVDTCCKTDADCDICQKTDGGRAWGDYDGCEKGFYEWNDENTSLCGDAGGICPAADGEKKCALVQPADGLLWWGLNISVLGLVVSFEILGLYYWGLKNCCKVANALDLRLKPLNKDRAFVGASLVRAALELGNTNEIVYGVDPLREQASAGSVVQAILAVMYVAKIAVSGFLIKIAVKRMAARGVLSGGTATYAMPWAAVPATCLWNGLIGHVTIKQAMLRGTGIASGIELFNSIVLGEQTEHTLSELGKLQVVRAVGCNIAKQRNMYPTKEVLLKHAVGTHVVLLLSDCQRLLKTTCTIAASLRLNKGGPAKMDESGVIDNVEDFIRDCSLMESPVEIDMMLRVLALSTVLDGRVRKRELQLLQAVVDTFPDKALNPHHCKLVAQRLRNLIPLSVADLDDCTSLTPSLEIDCSYHLQECTFFCTKWMAC